MFLIGKCIFKSTNLATLNASSTIAATTTTTTSTTATTSSSSSETFHSSNYRWLDLSIPLVTSSALLQCTSSSTEAIAFVVVLTIGPNQYSCHGKFSIDFWPSIIAPHIVGKNEKKTVFVSPECNNANDDQINRISVTMFIMNNVINHIVNPVCRCGYSYRLRHDVPFLLLPLIRPDERHRRLNVSNGAGHMPNGTKFTTMSTYFRFHRDQCDVCDGTDDTIASCWRWQRTPNDQRSYKIIYFNEQSIRNWHTSDDVLIGGAVACQMRRLIRVEQQLICDLCENILTIKQRNECCTSPARAQSSSTNFDLNSNSNLSSRLDGIVEPTATAHDDNDKLLVYSIICTKHCRRRRGRRRPPPLPSYRMKCAHSPNGWQLQQMVHRWCHAHANSYIRWPTCGDAINSIPYDVFMCPFHNDNNNSIYCQQAYLNGLLVHGKPSGNIEIDVDGDDDGSGGDAMSLPRSTMTDCVNPNGYMLMMKSLKWMSMAKLHSISSTPAASMDAIVVAAPSSIPNDPLTSGTLLSIASETHDDAATQPYATITTTDAEPATQTMPTGGTHSMALNQRNAIAPTKTLTALAANRRISRINSAHRTNDVGCRTTTTPSSTTQGCSSIGVGSNASAGTTYLKRHLYLLLIAFLTCCAPFASATSMHNVKYSTNVVKTKYGQLRGIVVRSNPTVEAYLGVPYATPPVGSLRYMPPVTPSMWKSTRLADRFSPVCPQLAPVAPTGSEALLEMPRQRLAQIRRLMPLLANQSEDCLYLNLYVPRTDEDPRNTGSKSLATIVYIHGESFEWNSGNPYDGSILAAHGNIIVVTINFRLGVLGFLKTGAKGSAQGNFGLMDLVAGLHWLRENLPAFNGDPSKVTLMGHGSGAVLANILIVSPVASDLIRRAILLSGSALSPWAIQKDPLYVKRKVAEHTGCHGDLVEDDLAPCLRTKTVAELLSVTLQMPRFLPGFAPFVDGTVIVASGHSQAGPLTLPLSSAIASTMGIEMADFASRELLFGLTTHESYLDLSAQDLEFGFNETRRDRILRTYVRNVYFYHLNEIYSALKNEYTDWEKPPRNPMGSRDAALELLSDGHTAAPLVRLAYMHSLRGGRSYFMHFKHQSSEQDFPQRSGSVRGEDVPYALGLPISPLFPHNYTKQDIKISRMMVQYLSNFAHTGNPNETPPSSIHISHLFKHNHIASPIELATSKLIADHIMNENGRTRKQKRQMTMAVSASSTSSMAAASTAKRWRNKRNHESYETDEERDDGNDGDDNDDDDDDGDDDEENRNETNERYGEAHNHDRLDDTSNQHIPFWDTYDSVNQLYLEVGNKIEIKNHYRGHKLSMWLSLIPQLHMPGDLTELAMRHHHFAETDKRFYDGAVRDQTVLMPTKTKPKPVPPAPPPTAQSKSTEIIVVHTSTTDCPSNSTVTPTLAATRPQHNAANSDRVLPNSSGSGDGATVDNGFFTRLIGIQFHSYSTALTVTIVVGCFLLLLNVLIFAGIYYQREKRATDAKRKEELTEVDCTVDALDCRTMESRRKKSIQSMAGFAPGHFGEYSCYDDKIPCKEKHLLADICSVEIPLQELKCTTANGGDSNSNSLRRGMHVSQEFKQPIPNSSANTLLLYPPTYSSPHPTGSISEAGSSNSSELVTYHQFQQQQQQHHHHQLHQASPQQMPPTEHCNQSTQSDIPDVHDVGTTVMEHEVDEHKSKTIDHGTDASSNSTATTTTRSTQSYQGGILRQQGGPTTPSASKKRVQIQEISV